MMAYHPRGEMVLVLPKIARSRLYGILILGLIAATAIAARRFGYEARTYWTPTCPTDFDFGTFFNGAMAVNAGQSPYNIEALRQQEFGPYYRNPPLLAIALVPLVHLGCTQAWHSWF